MTWIKTIPYAEASGALEKLYNRVKGPDDNIDNILLAHSLRPHTLKGHMVLYKNVLHHSDNTFPKWFLEAIGVYVSMLNKCDYCVVHHYTGLKRLLNDAERSTRIWNALKSGHPEDYFNGTELAAIEYAAKLTTDPSGINERDIDHLRDVGLKDGEILEINQVASYFSYANRTVLGLGVTIDGDVLGLSPGDSSSEDNWSHA